MALTITVEDGTNVTGANSFISLANAEIFFESEIEKAEWTAADDATKNIALANAARIMDEQYRWKGTRSNDPQPMPWPRQSVTVEYRRISSSTIPTPIINAQCLIALEFLQQLSFQAAASNANDIKSLGLGQGALEVEYQAASDSADKQSTVLSSRIRTSVRLYGRSAHGSHMVPVHRG
tara:strand:- start:3298 stop:3834 length:537 start_codon:yes stop_codon:yes gene_type:complete